MRTVTLLVALLIALLLGSATAVAGKESSLASFPFSGRLDYKIDRDGTEVGFCLNSSAC